MGSKTIEPAKMENFERAFMNGGTVSAQCECGKQFYNENDLCLLESEDAERLEKDPDAIALDCGVGLINFEGRYYVDSCDCWKERAERLINFIDGHSHSIVSYLKAEKKRALEEANNMATIDI